MRIMATWVNKKDMPAPAPGQHKIFIFAMTQNYEAQIHIENDLAAAALEKEIPTIKSIDAFGPILTLDKLPKTDVLLKAIRDLGCDYIVWPLSIFDRRLIVSSSGVYTIQRTCSYYDGYYA
jgi:hypothetical protein